VYTEFEVLKVKVLIIFLGTVGFSLRREGRYTYLYNYSNLQRRFYKLQELFLNKRNLGRHSL
jgi:hypothetical protein